MYSILRHHFNSIKLFGLKFNKLHKNKPLGFTLVELLVVILIIGVLSTLTIIAVNEMRIKARDAKRVNDLKQIGLALELYYDDHGEYPPELEPGQPLAYNFDNKEIPMVLAQEGDSLIVYFKNFIKFKLLGSQAYAEEGYFYMSRVPSNPQPRTDGDCPDIDYLYISVGQDYTIYTCLGKGAGSYSAGVIVKTSSALASVDSMSDKFTFINMAKASGYNMEYTVKYEVDGQGFISGTKEQTVSYGSEAEQVSAIPYSGYQFNGWSDGRKISSRKDTVTRDQVFVASFGLLQSYTVSYTAGSGGSISGSANQTILHGSSGSYVLAVPASGYMFEKWSDNKTNAQRIETNVTSNMSFQAIFKDSPLVQCGETITDLDGNVYNTVQIGSQCWMKENMNIGTMLASGATMPSNNNVIEKWCYNNNIANCGVTPAINHGGLYTWAEAMNLPTTCLTTNCSAQIQTPHQGICPNGFHIPTDQEFNTLEQYTLATIASTANQYACNTSTTGWLRCADNSGTEAGGAKGAGKSIKKVGQGTPGTVGEGDDLVGFSAMLSGYRHTNGSFDFLSSNLYSWLSSQASSNNAWNRTIISVYSTVDRRTNDKAYGFSVRCVKN